MKRILAFVVVLSVLLSVCSISAAAAPVYSVAADIQSFAVSPLALDSRVSTLATGDSIIIDSANTLYWQQYSSQLGNLIVNYFYGGGFSPGSLLYNIYQISQVVSTSLSSIDLSVGAIRTEVASILNDMGAITSAIQTTITAIETNTTAVGQVNTSVGQVNTSVGDVETAVSNLEDALSEYMTLPSGNFILATSGFSVESTSVLNVTDIMRRGFIGISAHLRSLSGSGFLNANGQQSVTTENQTLSYILRYGFLGLRSLIAGSESDNAYSLTLWDNNNASHSGSATGLGPMLNTSLNNLGANLAKLTFMFAADDDIQLKSDSQPVLDEVTDTVFGTGSGKVKLDVSNVSDLTGMSDDVLGYFETGGQMGDINTVVNDDSTWLWFTSQTAADLDTTGSSLSRAAVELEPDADSHTEWYASFYRDVLGRDYVGG